jgi:hypothetical protein
VVVSSQDATVGGAGLVDQAAPEESTDLVELERPAGLVEQID